jgi:hypothetical protein
LLHALWVIKDIKEEIRNFLEFYENASTTYQSLWDTAKTILRGMIITMNAYIKNAKISQIIDLMLNFKVLEKQEQAKPKTSRRREK